MRGIEELLKMSVTSPEGKVSTLGISRQRVNVALRTLQSSGLIRIEARGMTVLDLDGLRNFAGVGG